MTTDQRSIFEREKRKWKQTSDLQSTIITFWVVPYTSVSCNRRIFVDVIVYIISDKHTTCVIEAVAVYTNNFKSLKKLIKLSNLCTCSSSEAMLKDVSAIKNCKIAW